jgi:hypothetical protein
MSESHKIIRGTSNKLIVSFAGSGNGMGNISKFEFVNFLEKYYSNYERHFYLDYCGDIWYHKGIEGISTNIDETIIYLKSIVKDFEQVIFIGGSAGGYASILFGSIIGVDKVIAFRPQTLISPRDSMKGIDKIYTDIKEYINATTKYYIFADMNAPVSSFHHVSQCERIDIYPNVIVNKNYEVDNMRVLRDNGSLKQIFDSHLNL